MTIQLSDEHIPRLVAHRGNAADYPENTMLAMQKALELGVVYLEMDVQLTRDAQPVLLHDPDLLRMSADPISIFDLDFKQLQNYRAAETQRFGQDFIDLPFAHLSEMTQLAEGNSNIRLLVEVKQDPIDHFGLEKTARIVTETLASVKPQVTIISYNAKFLAHIKQHYQFEIGLVLTYWSDIKKHAQSLQPEMVISNYEKIPDDYVDFAQCPWSWVLYEITDSATAMRFALLGVQFIETMEVQAMINNPVLAKKACFA